ncbi:MAG: hypothetical protein K0R76_1106 [Alphaproteobacteria bacterium]|nr:hypothetical protein [Alphaproteobacteria bacterium]MDF3034152.1 hypothetical protein [Alphaproteobacteria bacterium]
MPDEPVRPFLNERTSALKLWAFCSPRYMVLLCFILFVIIIGAVLFLQPGSWFANTHAKDIALLKNQAAALNSRVDHLETVGKMQPLIDPERLKDIEARIATLYQQVEVIQHQPKAEALPPQPLQPLTLEREVTRLAETQKTLKSILLFWQLKAKVLSEAPYMIELDNFKTANNGSEDLEILEKYANQGLQAMKETPKDISLPSERKIDSWWEQLKTMTASFIKIEKVNAPIPLPSPLAQDRQAVEEALTQLDQTLTQQLTKISFTSSPLPGDTL